MFGSARWIAAVIFVSSTLGLLAIGGSCWLWPPTPILVRNPVFEIDPAEPRGGYTASYVLRNRSAEAVSIVGAMETCGPEGCIEVQHPALPAVIGPWKSLELRVHYQAGSPGLRLKTLPLYTDHPRQTVIEVAVRARVAEDSPSLTTAVP